MPSLKASGKGKGTRSRTLRRQPAKGIPRLLYAVRQRWFGLLELYGLWAVLFIGVGTWCLVPKSAWRAAHVDVGSIATQTFVADRDLTIVDSEATAAVRRSAAEAVRPVYDFDHGIETDRIRQLSELFSAGRELLEAQPGQGGAGIEQAGDDGVRARLAERSSFKVDSDQFRLLRARRFEAELEERLRTVLSRTLRQGVVSDRALLLEHRVEGVVIQDLPSGDSRVQLDLYQYLDYPEQVEVVVDEELTSAERKGRDLLLSMLVSNVTPNLTLNSSATLDLRRAAAEAAGAVTHTRRKGEVIVRRGARIDFLAAASIAEMAGTHGFRSRVVTVLGTSLLVSAAAFFLVLIARREHSGPVRSRERVVSEYLLLLLLHLLGAKLAFFVATAVGNSISGEWSSVESLTFAIPFATLAFLSVLLYGRSTALVLSLVYAVLVGRMAEQEALWSMTAYAVVASLAVVFALDQTQFRQRSIMTRLGLLIGMVNAIAALMLLAIGGELDGGVGGLGFGILCGFSSGLLAAALTSFSVPVLESVLSVTTSIKLIELSNSNLPLLRRVALEAPGTFQHSLAVANLAKAGGDVIGGDSVLINTSALYHDIGKVFRPGYFIENQTHGRNPHEKIQPTMSALILINHIKEGVELATHYHLPALIIDAIEQHHGTRLIKFFYNRAQERCDPDTDEVREADFRYPGPKPQSKEMGVIMLADAVEAASRTLNDPSRQKLRNLVQTLFEDCLQDGQLDESDLTLGDLRKVRDAFVEVLLNIHHRRIDYPGFDFNKERVHSGSTGAEKAKPEQQRETAKSKRELADEDLAASKIAESDSSGAH